MQSTSFTRTHAASDADASHVIVFFTAISVICDIGSVNDAAILSIFHQYLICEMRLSVLLYKSGIQKRIEVNKEDTIVAASCCRSGICIKVGQRQSLRCYVQFNPTLSRFPKITEERHKHGRVCDNGTTLLHWLMPVHKLLHYATYLSFHSQLLEP
ncbi:hypothetical protein Tco_0110621 [Tanacetum coccineum]